MSQYASVAELVETGLPAEAVALDDPTPFLVAASNLADTYLRGRYSLPVTGGLGPPNTYPPELTVAVIAIAAFDFLAKNGFNPDRYDENYRIKRDFYLGNTDRGTKGWLDKLAAGAVSISAVLDASPETHEGAALVVRGLGRGWDEIDQYQLGELEGSFWWGRNR